MRRQKNPLQIVLWGALGVIALVVLFKVILPLVVALVQIALVVAVIAALVYGVWWLVQQGKNQNRVK